MKTKYSNVFINPTEDELDGHRTIIAFDMDSVLNEGDYLKEYIAKRFGYNSGLDIRGKGPEGYEKFSYEIPGVSRNKVYKAIHEGVYEESPSALPSPFMADVLKYVYQVTGEPIAVVTARAQQNAGVTYRWLTENLGGTPFRAYVMDGVTKNTVLNLLYTQIFVDDRWKTIMNLLGEIPYPVMFKRPWNQGRPVRMPALEIRDLRDIIPLLNIQLGRVPMEWPGYIPYPNRIEPWTSQKYL